MPVDKHGVDWDEMDGLMRPYEESDEAAQPEGAEPVVLHLRKKDGEKGGQKGGQKSRAGSRWRIWPRLPLRRKPKPGEKPKP